MPLKKKGVAEDLELIEASSEEEAKKKAKKTGRKKKLKAKKNK